MTTEEHVAQRQELIKQEILQFKAGSHAFAPALLQMLVLQIMARDRLPIDMSGVDQAFDEAVLWLRDIGNAAGCRNSPTIPAADIGREAGKALIRLAGGEKHPSLSRAC